AGGVEGGGGGGGRGTWPAEAARLGARTPHPARRRDLVLRLVASEDLPDFEQGDIGEPAIGILLRRRDQARDQARAHVGKLGGDRIGERKLGLAAAEQPGLRLADE